MITVRIKFWRFCYIFILHVATCRSEMRSIMRAKVKGNTLILIISGDVDHHSSEIIKQIADKRIMENNIRNIIFDFSKSTFMDSSGIGVVIGRYKLVNMAGGRIAAVNINPTIDRIFVISGLNKIIERYDTVEDALMEYQKG